MPRKIKVFFHRMSMELTIGEIMLLVMFGHEVGPLEAEDFSLS